MQKNFLNVWLFILVICLLAVGLTVMLPPASAQAQAGLELSTRYPGITAVPGESLTFPLDIRNNGWRSQAVDLSVVKKPEGWKTTLKGRGRTIHKVFAGKNSLATADLEVKVPADVSPGSYSLTVKAAGEGGGSDYLHLNIIISKEDAGGDELVAQYSELKGPSDAIFKFRVDLTNNSAEEQSYSLGAAVPRGWQVSISPAYKDQQIASLSVKPGETEGLDIKVTPPAQVEAGEYTIPVQAVSSGRKASTNLKIIISGTYDLEFTTPSGRLNADVVAGQEKKINLEVRNTGSAVLQNINFSSREPQDWSVSFDPKTVDALEPGESRQISATIKADNKAIAGDYVVSLNAGTRETRDQADLRVTVKTSTLWGVVGLFIILLVVAGVYGAFRTYGRR